MKSRSLTVGSWKKKKKNFVWKYQNELVFGKQGNILND